MINERHFFTDNQNSITVLSDTKQVVIKCEKLKSSGIDLEKTIVRCIESINNTKISDFNKYESYPISVLAALDECQTRIIDGLPQMFTSNNEMSDCKIKFDLIFDIMGQFIDFRKVDNIKY